MTIAAAKPPAAAPAINGILTVLPDFDGLLEFLPLESGELGGLSVDPLEPVELLGFSVGPLGRAPSSSS